MPQHRRNYTKTTARRTSRAVRNSTVGTHVARDGRQVRRNTDYAESIRRKARLRRFLAGFVAVVIVLAVGIGAGLLAFRGLVGSSMALKDSNAGEALSQPKSGETYYALVTLELGATAKPLDNPGPDVLILARIDPSNNTLSLINIPGSLQIVEDNKSVNVASTALKSDADLINAIETFAKVDISHLIKVDQEGILGIAEALGGIDVDLSQTIDDPHAGTIYLPQGNVNLKGEGLLTYLRAENLKLGIQDKMTNQLNFATTVLDGVFLQSSGFQTKLESIDSYFQTDCSFGDFEQLANLLSGQKKSDIVTVNLPGYKTAVTGVSDDHTERYISTSDEIAKVLETLQAGKRPTSATDSVQTVDPGSFTVEVQNGTSITGAASVTGDLLKSKGFNVTQVGNAEQQVYEETLAVYKDPSKRGAAQTVVDALDVGRTVDGGDYYNLSTDVLLIIGSDYTPFT